MRSKGIRGCWFAITVVAAVFLHGCGGGGDGGDPPTPPDLAGVWAGAWQGSDPNLGLISGTWEVAITQGASSASGPGSLLGDIDCIDGQMQTTSGSQTPVRGTLTRQPCATVNWTLTGLNADEGSATGSWSNQGTGGLGTLTGVRIARLGGPRILYFHPPAGRPGTVVTIRGTQLAPLTSLRFNLTQQPSVVLPADATRIVARVPFGATTGHVEVTTSTGSARSPLLFSVDVTSPPATVASSLAVGTQPAAVAVSPDGRKVYVADRAGNTVKVLRASTLSNGIAGDELLAPPTAIAGGSPRSIAVSPDGRLIFVAVTGVGVLAMDAPTAGAVAPPGTISVTSLNDQGRDNPQGIAISPDGKLLLVSDGSAG